MLATAILKGAMALEKLAPAEQATATTALANVLADVAALRKNGS